MVRRLVEPSNHRTLGGKPPWDTDHPLFPRVARKISRQDSWSPSCTYLARFQTNSRVVPVVAAGLVNSSCYAVREAVIRLWCGAPVVFAQVLPLIVGVRALSDLLPD